MNGVQKRRLRPTCSEQQHDPRTPIYLGLYSLRSPWSCSPLVGGVMNMTPTQLAILQSLHGPSNSIARIPASEDRDSLIASGMIKEIAPIFIRAQHFTLTDMGRAALKELRV